MPKRNEPIPDKFMVVYRNEELAINFETADRDRALDEAHRARHRDSGTVEVFERIRFWDLNEGDDE